MHQAWRTTEFTTYLTIPLVPNHCKKEGPVCEARINVAILANPPAFKPASEREGGALAY